MNALQTLAMQYANSGAFPGFTGDPDYEHMRSVLLDISKTKGIEWQDTSVRGIASRLREEFPFKSPWGKTETFIENATPEAAGHWFWFCATWVDDIKYPAMRVVYGELYHFCIAVSNAIHYAARDQIAAQAVRKSTKLGYLTTGLTRDDITIDVRARFGIRHLCQFCWRPAILPRAKTCHRHSQLAYMNEQPSRYMRARRQGLKTPAVVNLTWLFGRVHVLDNNPLAKALRLMRDDWEYAVKTKVAQVVIDCLTGATYIPLKESTEYSSWSEFHSDLLRAFDAAPESIPDDPDYTAIWLPHAIEEVKQEREWEVSHSAISLADVLAIRDEMRGRRGWRSEAARRLGVSRQRVSQILRKHGFS